MIFITFPRSGVNFITRAIAEQTGVSIEYQHNFYATLGKGQTTRLIDSTEDYIINIVRNPADSMASWLSMQYERDDTSLINNGYIKITKTIHIPKYINLYKQLFSHDNVIFIDYNDFNDNLHLILKKLYKILKLEIINNHLDVEHLKISMINEAKEKYYLYGSKNYSKYQEIRETLDTIDLSQCYDLYYKALERCIKI